MDLKASFRGISLPDDTMTDPTIEEPGLPQRVILPLGRNADSVCEPVVGVGDGVKTGQLLGRSTGFLTAPVHSSVSGRVADIRPWFDHNGNEVLSVIVDSDGEDSWLEEPHSNTRFLEKENAQILADLRDSGVVATNPPAVPLHAKFGRPEPSRESLFLTGIPPAKPIDTLIVNGIDAEPGMALKRAVLQEKGSEIVAGMRIIQKLLDGVRMVLAVSSEAPLDPSTRSGLAELGVQVFQGKDKYPLGLDPILIKCITDREIPLPDGNELDIGVATVDLGSLVHLVEAVRDGKPQVEKVVSISGAGLTSVRNLRVRLGTPIRTLMEQIGGFTGEPVKVIAGGAMTGQALFSQDIPVTKETDCLIFQTAGEATSFSSDACINCGLCVRHCPARLLPSELSKYCEFGLFEDAREKYLFHCIECGICAYVCPEARPMLHLLRFGKRELRLTQEVI